MSIERLSFDSKHTYSDVTKDDFNFEGGGDSKKRATGVGIGFSAYRRVMLKLDGSNDVFIFLIYPSRSKLSTPKGSHRVCTRS